MQQRPVYLLEALVVGEMGFRLSVPAGPVEIEKSPREDIPLGGFTVHYWLDFFTFAIRHYVRSPTVLGAYFRSFSLTSFWM